MSDTFTPEQIAQILQGYFEEIGTRKYIGERYVPIFGRRGESNIDWDDSAPYEPLTIVLYNGDSYTSRQYVPAGVAITDSDFWAKTGDYNAAIVQLRDDMDNAENAIDNLNAIIPALTFDSEHTVKDYVDTSISTALSTPKKLLTFGDSWGNDGDEWPVWLAQNMGLTRDVYNVSGASFPFASQISAAAANYPTSDDQKSIECAVVYGGVNNATSQLITNFSPWSTFITSFRSSFPNVPLYVFPMNVPPCKYNNDNYPTAYENVFKSMEGAYAYFAGQTDYEYTYIIPNCFFMLNNVSANSTFDTSNYLHPITAGSKIIAKNMYDAINGRYQSYSILPRAAIPTGVTINRHAYVDVEGLHTADFSVNCASLDDTGEYLCYLNNYQFGAMIQLQYEVFDSHDAYIEDDSNITMQLNTTGATPYITISFKTNTGVNSTVLSGYKTAGNKLHIKSKIVPFKSTQSSFG